MAERQPSVLIAGGAGFLGSHLCDHYFEAGLEVVSVDNMSTGDQYNLGHLNGRNGFTSVEADIVEPLPTEVIDRKYSLIINMASPASPPKYQDLALETLQVGSAGTLNLLELARQNGARFVHASTSEVYGDPQVHPQTEDYWGNVNPYGVRSMYDESKRYAEALIHAYRAKHGISTGIMRIFNTYGPRMDPHDGRVVSNFVNQALAGEPLTVYGEGTQTRSFCYVDDLVYGITKLASSKHEGPVNLGNPVEFTILQLGELVLERTGSKSELVFEPLPGDDPMQRCPDIAKAKEELNWEPMIPLKAGLIRTIQYFKALRQSQAASSQATTTNGQ